MDIAKQIEDKIISITQGSNSIEIMRRMSKNLNSDITKLITRYLSIREHSRLELKNKLTDKGYHPKDISEAIDEFSLKDIQSDVRFAEEFIRSRLKKQRPEINCRRTYSKRYFR